MNPPQISSTTPATPDAATPSDDAFLTQFDDETIEHAIKTVGWQAKDVSQFLRSSANR